MKLRITIDGTPVSAVIGSVSFTQQMSGRTSTAAFRLSVSDNSIPDLLSEVIIYKDDDNTKLFGGYITDVQKSNSSTTFQTIDVTCAGYEYLLQQITANHQYTSKTDRQIIQDAFIALSEIATTNSTVSQLGVALNFNVQDQTLQEMLETLAKIVGAEWKISPNKELIWRAEGTAAAPFSFSDSPNGTTSFPVRIGNRSKNVAGFANRVTVRGAYGSSGWLTSTTNDTASQTALGRVIEAVVPYREIDNQAALDLAASIELQQRAPLDTITIEWDHGISGAASSLLESGMLVTVSSTGSDISGNYVIQQLSLKQASPDWTIFQAQIGDYRGFLNRLTRQLDRIKKGPTIVTAGPPPPNSVGSPELKDDAVTSLKLADAAVNAAKIEVASLTGAVLAAGAVTETKIADNAISTPKLQAGSVVAASIGAGAVIAGKVAANAIVGSNIQAGSIAAANAVFAVGTIVNADIANATISGAKIASATISGGNIASTTISDSNIANSTITGAKIASATIDGANIKSATIDGANIKSSTISDSNIASATITGAKIASATIDGANIKSATIDGANIKSATITNTNIANATITSAKIASIDASIITTGSLDAARISAGSITGTKLADGSISAVKITSIDASTITAGSLSVSRLTVGT